MPREPLIKQGTVLKSESVYEPDHWYHVVLKEGENGFTVFDYNCFNLGYITFKEVCKGYRICDPLECYESVEEYDRDLQDGIRRWIDE